MVIDKLFTFSHCFCCILTVQPNGKWTHYDDYIQSLSECTVHLEHWVASSFVVAAVVMMTAVVVVVADRSGVHLSFFFAWQPRSASVPHLHCCCCLRLMMMSLSQSVVVGTIWDRGAIVRAVGHDPWSSVPEMQSLIVQAMITRSWLMLLLIAVLTEIVVAGDHGRSCFFFTPTKNKGSTNDTQTISVGSVFVFQLVTQAKKTRFFAFSRRRSWRGDGVCWRVIECAFVCLPPWWNVRTRVLPNIKAGYLNCETWRAFVNVTRHLVYSWKRQNQTTIITRAQTEKTTTVTRVS